MGKAKRARGRPAVLRAEYAEAPSELVRAAARGDLGLIRQRASEGCDFDTLCPTTHLTPLLAALGCGQVETGKCT